MARKPSPWYREERDEWCVTIKGIHHRLGGHPEGAPKPQKSKKTGRWNAPQEIEKAFRQLLDSAEEEVVPETAPTVADDVISVLDDFLVWCRENREAITAKRYEEFCQDFVRATDERGVKLGLLPISKLTSRHVTGWLNGHETWGPTTKRSAITALQRGFNWAVKNRGLERNPIRGMEKPEARRRSDVITPAEFEEVLDLTGDSTFADLLIVSYDSGARPFEVKDLETRHLQLDKQRAIIPADEAKGRRHTRTIYFPTERSMDILRRLASEHPEGPLFRNNLGNRWTGAAVKCRFEDIEIAFGLKEMERQGVALDVSEESIAAVVKTLLPTRKQRETGQEVPKQKWELRKEARQKLIASQARKYGTRFNHYAFRRTFITGKIIAGVDSHVVAKLSGHQSTAMIDRHYSAVANDHQFMLQEAMRQIQPKQEGGT
jgi:integrase